METQENPLIGVIGGVGPYAGLDFFKNILDNTVASRDQEHISAILLSCPVLIQDRTEFILGNAPENPAFAMFECAKRLHVVGVKYASIPCNTAHSGVIFTPFIDMVHENLPGLVIVNMLETCVSHIKQNLPGIKRIGYLASKGTYNSRVYHEYFKAGDGFSLIEPEEQEREQIHEAIYSKDFGIKAHSSPVHDKAQRILHHEVSKLLDRGAEAVILGCTELPLAINPADFYAPVIDPGKITARKLINLVAPQKLRRD
ncbi:MAG: amino acid racemase [Spirochaetaceae bacterium]|jgi:aspartate racemase|nr:amino acid racemase [Spirochaetaceae bacterium]